MMTLEALMETYFITTEIQEGASDDYAARHPYDRIWTVTFTRTYGYTEVFTLSVPFHGDKPTAGKAFNTLLDEVHSIESNDFEGWCSEMCYTSDEPEDVEQYHYEFTALSQLSDELHTFLGEYYDDIMYGHVGEYVPVTWDECAAVGVEYKRWLDHGNTSSKHLYESLTHDDEA